jgi:hypothetical protein
LKLDHPQQFTSVFEENQSTHNYNIKLLILYRFCCVGGALGKGGRVGKLAQELLQDLLKNMSELEEEHLEQLLQLFFTFREKDAA